jgi:hypothetical protein
LLNSWHNLGTRSSKTPKGRMPKSSSFSNLAAFARRAWRGPVSAAEVAKLESFVRMAQADGTDEVVIEG